MGIVNFVRNALGMAPKPQKPGAALNNVLHIERIRHAHFVNTTDRAIRACQLSDAHKSRAKHHAEAVWRKHMDNVHGYTTQRECEQSVRDYIDRLAAFQRNDQPAAKAMPWWPKGAA